MSSENIVSGKNRSRSIFRQVRDTLGSLNRTRHRTESPSSKSVNTARASADNIDVEPILTQNQTKRSIPNSFSHRLSLFDHVKFHISKNRKPHQIARTSLDSDEFTHVSLSSITPVSESKSTNLIAPNQDSDLNKLNSNLFIPLTNTAAENLDSETALLPNSLDMVKTEDDIQHTNDTNNSFQKSFKDQIMQNPKVDFHRNPSITSILTNISLPSPILGSDVVYLIELWIESAKDLSIKDLNGTSDPYVKVFYDSEEKHTTKIILKSLNPIWNEKCSFFVHNINIPICFNLFDYDRIGRDEPMGSTKIDLWKLPLENKYSTVLSLENEKRSDGKIGTITVSLTITPKTSEFRDEVLRSSAKPTNTGRHFSLAGRSAIYLPTVITRRIIEVFIIEGRKILAPGNISKTGSPFVRLKFGANKKNRTQTIKTTTNPKWYQLFTYEITAHDLPLLELTVVDDSSNSGELIGRTVCHLTQLEEEKTHSLSLDLDDNAGVIDLLVTISGIAPTQDGQNDADSCSSVSTEIVPSKLTEEDIEHYSFLSAIKSIKPISDVGKLEIKIYQARDLSAKDINGKSDPYCLIELDSTRLRTHTIYKTLDPVWNKSFVLPIQDIHSVLELTIYDEDTNQASEFIGKIAIPLLSIKNGEKKWFSLKDRKCILPVKGIIEIEATFIYTNLKAILRTFNPRQIRYYQQDNKFRVGIIKQHINRVRYQLRILVNAIKFINYCFEWENPLLSLIIFILSLVLIWNFELYMLPLMLLLIFAWNAVVQYRRGVLGKAYSTLDDTVSAVIQPVAIDEDALDSDIGTKEQKKTMIGFIQGVQDTLLEIQGYADGVASTLERIKNVFNFTVPWLSTLAIIVLTIVSIILYYIPLRYLLLAFTINKFTKRFRKPKGYIDNNELADFISRLPSDPELMQYRELKILSRIPTPKKNKRCGANTK